MPYLPLGRKLELLTEPERADTPGDLNFLFTREYLRAFIADPSYSTIALIKSASLEPQHLPRVRLLTEFFEKKGIASLAIKVARDLAFLEFYERIGRLYEQHARLRNGDVSEYEIALLTIVDKFNGKK